MNQPFRMLIAGDRLSSDTSIDVVNPATGRPFAVARQSGPGGELGQAGLQECTQAHIINAVAVA